ncbi:hypothetical protein [Thiorhodococcus minor]|uniref:Uncharacterized protein n=1 Tax=Thiorhodococcus minor TaxID=57489 RepID=A0A6M0K0X1_9GAMM|nr:hypothetical protein [Thiorhodococcus minor]NEV63019.1 hypothetical protein [Thiorhodococcus minor]
MKILSVLKKFWRDDEGNEVVSWPLIAALVAIAALLAWGVLTDQVSGTLDDIGGAIESAGDEVADASGNAFSN